MNDPFRYIAIRPRSDRRGFALIAVLVVMVVLGLIGGAALKLTAGDQRVTRLFSEANQADAAAAAGLEHAIAVFQTNGVFPLVSAINGYSYTVTDSVDLFDYNGDSVADTVYLASDGTFNEAGDGHVVHVLQSTATKGSFKAVQRIRVSKRTLNIQAPSALTTNSSANLTGNITIDGRNHTTNGTLQSDNGNTGACTENKPAVTVTDSTKTISDQGSVLLNGHSDYSSNDPPYTNKDEGIVYVTPEDVLGLDPGDLDSAIQDADSYVVPDSISGLVYIDGDYGSTGIEGTNTVNGTGVLIVHNPLYNPREHDPADPMYDAAKASNLEVYGPANLGNINGGTFHGLIIADKINRINGNIDIIGAVVSLTEIDITLVGNGTAEILYSCSSLTQAANSSPLPPARLAWSAD
ncbi:MAG TPA: prepilin-type N-terminal cleavage/methylation domain-containing protein [Gemmatimonadota bacterium]|jgi:Tfp pilus assembly protein PilX|nr:prepilin-type N-terminal cleavage/methylation domain-containing protein [Gemmatimonadota bacterium]